MLASPLLDEAYPVGVGLRRATTTPDLRRPRSTDGPVSRISSFLEVVPHPSDAPTHMRTHVAADVEHARAWQKSSQRTAHSPTPHRQSLTTAGSQRTAHSPTPHRQSLATAGLRRLSSTPTSLMRRRRS